MDELRVIKIYCEITGASEARARSAYMFLMVSHSDHPDAGSIRSNGRQERYESRSFRELDAAPINGVRVNGHHFEPPQTPLRTLSAADRPATGRTE